MTKLSTVTSFFGDFKNSKVGDEINIGRKRYVITAISADFVSISITERRWAIHPLVACGIVALIPLGFWIYRLLTETK